MSPVETTLAESEPSFTERDIWAVSILSTLRTPMANNFPLESATSSSLGRARRP